MILNNMIRDCSPICVFSCWVFVKMTYVFLVGECSVGGYSELMMEGYATIKNA